MRLTILLPLWCCAITVGAQAQPRRDTASLSTANTVARNQNHPTSIAVDDANVYYVSDSGSIKKLGKSGGAAPTTVLTGQKEILKIVLDADSIYFMTSEAIGRVSKTGPPSTVLAKIAGYSSGYETFLALDKRNVYFMLSADRGGERIAK